MCGSLEKNSIYEKGSCQGLPVFDLKQNLGTNKTKNNNAVFTKDKWFNMIVYGF
jgi:hypothetical protein